MKKQLLSVFISMISVAAIAQTTDDYYAPAKPKMQVKDRVSGSIMAGTGVSFLSNSKTTAFSTFIAPKINYKISEKFTLNAGLLHYTVSPNSAFMLNRSESIINNRNYNASGNLVFVGGSYQLNKKVTVCGAVMTDMSSINNRQKNNYKAATIGMDYKVSEHSTIGFRATLSQGSSDYNFDPKRGSYEYYPLHNNTFGSMLTGMGEWSADALNGSIR